MAANDRLAGGEASARIGFISFMTVGFPVPISRLKNHYPGVSRNNQAMRRGKFGPYLYGQTGKVTLSIFARQICTGWQLSETGYRAASELLRTK
jgi:hypothetical protein